MNSEDFMPTDKLIALLEGMRRYQSAIGPSMTDIAADRIRTLLVIVERLPITADRVRIIPCLDRVYHGGLTGVVGYSSGKWFGVFADSELKMYPVEQCFSTEEASKEAEL